MDRIGLYLLRLANLILAEGYFFPTKISMLFRYMKTCILLTSGVLNWHEIFQGDPKHLLMSNYSCSSNADSTAILVKEFGVFPVPLSLEAPLD